MDDVMVRTRIQLCNLSIRVMQIVRVKKIWEKKFSILLSLITHNIFKIIGQCGVQFSATDNMSMGDVRDSGMGRKYNNCIKRFLKLHI